MTSLLNDVREPTRDDLLAQLAELRGMSASVAVIEQAKGALMVTYGLTADEAFDLLRFHSQTRNVKLRAIAAELTALLPSSQTHIRATRLLDQLIDGVTRGLQTPAQPGIDSLPRPPGTALR